MNPKRLTMDVDFSDEAYFGRTKPEQLDELFIQMQNAGFDAAIWDTFWCGTSLYHSDKLPLFSNSLRWESPKNMAALLKEWDPFARALKRSKETGIQILPYFRMLEEAYAPFDGDKFFRDNPEFWWQTRCGAYRMVGWPCYSYPEVREHMLERVDDLVEHGATGAFFDIARTHIPYFCVYSLGKNLDVFGYNKPVVDEFKRRYGIDLSDFDHTEEISTAERGPGMPFVYEYAWVGTQPHDVWAFKRLIGEGFELFLREVRSRYPDFYIAMQTGQMESGGRPDEPALATFRIDLEGLCRDGIVDEYSVPANYRGTAPDINSYLLPRFDNVKASGKQLTAWLNDILVSDGGGGGSITREEIDSYIDRFIASDIDGAFIHEAAFIRNHPDAEYIWQQMRRLKG